MNFICFSQKEIPAIFIALLEMLDKKGGLLYNIRCKKIRGGSMHKNIGFSQKIFKICLSVLTGLVAAQFIVQVWWLFLSGGETPYTVESIAYHFSMIKGYGAWILLVVVGGIVFPEQAEKTVGLVETEKKIERLKERLPLGYQTEEMKKTQKLQKILCWVCFAICAVVSVCIMILMLNTNYEAAFTGAFFQSHTEAEKLVWVALLSIAMLGCCSAAAYVNERSRVQELALVKAAIAENAKKGIKAEKRESAVAPSKFAFLGTEKSVLISRIALGVIGLVFVVAGISNGGMADVLEKAVQICTQCIGLG